MAKLYTDLEQASRALANLLGVRIPIPSTWTNIAASCNSRAKKSNASSGPWPPSARNTAPSGRSRTVRPLTSKRPCHRERVLVDFLEYDHYGPPERGAKKWTWQRRLAAFVVRPDHAVERLDLGPAGPIEKTVEKWRAAYSAEEAAKLKQLVWKPLEPFAARRPDGVDLARRGAGPFSLGGIAGQGAGQVPASRS